MKTLHLPPAKTLFLNFTMAIILLPFFALFGPLLHFFGVALSGLAAELWSRMPAWEQGLLLALVVIAPLVALLMILRKAWSRLPLVVLVLLLVLTFLILDVLRMGRPDGLDGHGHVDLLIGQDIPTTGVDVFCNGVHLGKTPMCISRKEFNEKVSPWTKPPRQDRLEHPSYPGEPWGWAKYTWVPNDVFERYGHWPPAPDFFPDNEKALAVLKSSRYWWHFEADGHQGLCGLIYFGGGSSGLPGRLEVNVNPQATYPALEPHLALVIDGLSAGKGRPNAAWIAHFRKYQNLLFLPFYEKARSDPRLRAALDAVVRAEFDLPQEPTPQDCDRIFAAILDRVESRGSFQIPSPESFAIDLMGNAAKDSVVRRFWEESPHRFTSSGQSGGIGVLYTIYRRSGEAVRQLPLEYAVKRLQPPELFDALVYHWARTGQNLELVGCYQNKAAAQLVIDYVQDVGRRGNSSFAVNSALAMAAGIINPSVEQYLRDFVRERGRGSDSGYHVMQFIEPRIGAAGIDQGELAGWVYSWAPLDDRAKRRFLLRINSPSTFTYMECLGGMGDPGERQNVIIQLAANPNPGLDRLLINAYGSTKEPQFAIFTYYSVTQALIKTDTPAIRKFIAETWQRKSDRATLLDGLVRQDKADLARLAWMMPQVEQLADAPSQVKAVRLLASFHTPEAQKLLDKWSREGNAEVRKAVEQQYQEKQKQNAEQARRLQQWSDLLAGKIQPEDLVPPQKPWDWNGKEYVQEKK